MVVSGLTLALFFAACDRDDGDMPPPPADGNTAESAQNDTLQVDTTAADSTVRFNYLALGDSYIIGAGLPESSRFPVQLNARLDAEDVPGMLAPDNLHPSAAQYSLWVDSFYEQVKSKLND